MIRYVPLTCLGLAIVSAILHGLGLATQHHPNVFRDIVLIFLILALAARFIRISARRE